MVNTISSHQEGPPFEPRNQVRSFLCGVCKFSGFSYPWKPCCVNPAYVQPTLLYMYLYLQPPRCSKYWKAINWSAASLINTRCGWSFFLSRPLSVSLLCVFLYLWQPACTWMHALTHAHTETDVGSSSSCVMWKAVAAAHPGVSMATGLWLADKAGTVTSLVSFKECHRDNNAADFFCRRSVAGELKSWAWFSVFPTLKQLAFQL